METSDTKLYNLTALSRLFNRDRGSVLTHIKYLNLYTEGQKNFPQSTVDQLIAFYEKYKDLSRSQLTVMIKKHNCLLKYGVESPNQREEVKQRKVASVRERYGVDNVSQLSEVVEKKKQTSLKHFGTEHPTQSSVVKEKSKKTCQEKYGVDYTFQSSEMREKSKQTSLAKYGTESPNSSPEVKEKQRQAYLERYGVEKPLQSSEFQDKRKKTIQDRYGTDNNSQTQEWRDNWKVKEPGILQKRKEVRLSRVDKFEKDNNCTQRAKLIKEYGLGWVSLDLPRLYYKGLQFISNEYTEIIAKYYNDHKDMLPKGVSQEEKDLVTWIKSFYSLEVIENSKQIIHPYELDIYIPDKKLAIEFNGDYWHSQEHGTSKKYHETKSKLCEEKGIRLIHIYECEWRYSKEKIQSLLRLALGVGYSKIGARQCVVKKITNEEAEPFNNKNHLQSHRRALITYGLFYEDELVQLMSFSHHKKYQWEIIRGCPGSNNQVVGGVSKLFKAFLREYNPDTVFSYCDFNKFDGRGYEALGMKFLGYTGPDKFYIDKSGAKVMRNPRKRKELEATCLFITYGAGSKKYLYSKEGSNV